MNLTISQQLAAFAARLSYDDIPEHVKQDAKLRFLDTIGVTIAAGFLGSGTAARQVVARMRGVDEATVVGLPFGVPAANAALANGMLAHALDFDDTHTQSVTHPSAIVVPVSAALTEAFNASAEECLVAAVAGTEVAIRLGSVAPAHLAPRGFHPTGVIGVFGAAVAAGRLLGLRQEEMAGALGIAGSQASGLMAWSDEGTDTKQLHAGWAGHSGILAAELASHGLTGPMQVFEGPRGFFTTYLGGRFDEEVGIVKDLGSQWQCLDVAFKTFPTCHLTHACVEALLSLRGVHGFPVDAIDLIVCYVPDRYIPSVLEPREIRQTPRTAYQAKFSMPYCLAAAAVSGGLTVLDFTEEALNRSEVTDLARRVSYEVQEFPEYPRSFPGGVRVHLRDGRLFEKTLRENRRLPPEDVIAKFRANASLTIGQMKVDALINEVLSLGQGGDLVSAMQLLRYDGQER